MYILVHVTICAAKSQQNQDSIYEYGSDAVLLFTFFDFLESV